MFVSVNDKNMSDLQLWNVDVKCEKTVQIKVLVKRIPEQTLQGIVMSEK